MSRRNLRSLFLDKETEEKKKKRRNRRPKRGRNDRDSERQKRRETETEEAIGDIRTLHGSVGSVTLRHSVE